MNIYVMQGEYLSENTFLLEKDGEILIIDPGASSERILAACTSLSAKPIAVLLTHGHVDHVFGAAGLQKAGIEVIAHEEEIAVIEGRANLALALSAKLDSFTPDCTLSREEEDLTIGSFSVKALHTPGHTQGGVCYLIDGALFSGDTLFCGSYGRTDFPTGDEQDLLCSIANVLFELPKDTPVYSGHSGFFASQEGGLSLAKPDTTIGDEYSTNPILNLL